MTALDQRLQIAAVNHLPAAASAIGIVALAAMGLLALGLIGPVHFAGAPVDQEVVMSAAWHALLGCLISSVMWCAGAGLAASVSHEGTPIGHLLLVGFPLSLIVLVTCCWLTLALPLGWVAALIELAGCISVFVWKPVRGEELKPILSLAACLVAPSVVLGCWMGLLMHGPTATLPGHPFGDIGYYASNIYTLQLQRWPAINLANEGEYLSPFNQFHSLLGAALIRVVPIDPFQFVVASGGSMFAFGLGLAVYSYISTRVNVEGRLPYMILALATVVSTWYPLWVVASTPMIIALPVTISVWYRASNEHGAKSALSNFSATIVGTVLGKVTSVVTLAPLAFANLLAEPAALADEWRKLSKPVRYAAILILVLALTYAGYMIVSFGPKYLQAGNIGPDSYERYQWVVQSHLPRRTVLPYLMRDIGTILLMVLAFGMLRWIAAAVVTVGLISALAFAYALRINLDCALMIVALSGIDRPDLLKRSRLLALATYLLCLPVIVHHDYGGGHSMSAVWLLCMVAMSLIVFAHQSHAQNAILLTRRNAQYATLAFAILGTLGLAAAARQQVAFLNQGDASMTITPAVRGIWTAVREKTPPNALIFTDQTGTEPGALASWNTYATTGLRQIYVAGWYQTNELRASPQLRMQKLRENESVLSGQLRPTDLSYRRGPYPSYFSVVSLARKMPTTWHIIYANAAYAIYRYDPQVVP